MIEKITAVITALESKYIIIKLSGLEIRLIANPVKFRVNFENEIFTYLHWSQEAGPVLFGFCSDDEKQAFKILMGCPKIGPVLAMSILTQTDAQVLFGMICNQDEKSLAKISGIGPKCAKNLIAFVQEKAALFLHNSVAPGQSAPAKSALLIDVREALLSLGYTSHEITKTFVELDKNNFLDNKNLTEDFNQILRMALKNLQKK